MPERVEPESLRSLLERLELHWRRLGAPIADSLAEGLPESAFDAGVTGLPFDLPSELRIWWGWHNGLRPDVPRRGYETGSIGPGSYWFLSLEEAIAEYRMNREIHTAEEAELNGVPEMFWHEGWMPFLTMQAERLYMDCGGVRPGEVTPVRAVSHEWEDFLEDRAPSLTATVDLWLQAFEAGYYSWDEAGGRWACDFADLPLEWRGTSLF